MSENFALIAEALVNQHYTAGPDEMKRVIADALHQAASGKADDRRNPREKSAGRGQGCDKGIVIRVGMTLPKLLA